MADVTVVKYSYEGEKFEILVKPDPALEYKLGKKKDLKLTLGGGSLVQSVFLAYPSLRLTASAVAGAGMADHSTEAKLFGGSGSGISRTGVVRRDRQSVDESAASAQW